ncbi:hypothetical protein KR018_008309 [Drosophila ironensis]|nr:hypothetical protein KR018_008309 [Drosophila ironensis]
MPLNVERRWPFLGLLVVSFFFGVTGDEGDACQVKANIPGICRASSGCDNIEGYLRAGALTTSEVPSCGYGLREEIICCPTTACCSDRTTSTTSTSTSTSTTTSTTTTTTLAPFREGNREPRLDENEVFFDFNQLLGTTMKPQKTHESMKMPTQSVGAWGIAPPAPRPRPTTTTTQRIPNWEWNTPEPRIVNRPITAPPRPRPKPGPEDSNLIHLVNDRLRQQGMQIEQAREVPMVTATQPTVLAIEDPFKPFMFRGDGKESERDREQDEEDSRENMLEPLRSTSTTTIRPNSTSRVNGPERPAVAACSLIRSRSEIPLTLHILDGVPVERGIYPHMAAIAYNSFGEPQYLCGGSLIASRFVLTAAHCVNTELLTPVYVRLGAVDIEKPKDGYQDIAVSNVMIHPSYVSSSKYYDVAILELAEEAKFSEFIRPACLYPDIQDPPLNAKLFVSGWGVINVASA